VEIVYATQQPPAAFTKSMFLAGPSPRRKDHLNWRIEALTLLEAMGYDGTVFVPLPEHDQWSHGYSEQVGWEAACLGMADVVVFWVPRDMETLPAFTTNMEFGMYLKSGKAILGFPEEAPKMRYLEHHADKECVPVATTLEGTLRLALDKLGEGARRQRGEREVPLFIWKLPHFQNWLTAQKKAGNRLDGAKLLWTFRVPPATKAFTLAYAMQVNVWVTAEGRPKTNEFIFSRPDIACIVGYRKPSIFSEAIIYLADSDDTDRNMEQILQDETDIALIREFRSTARTRDGFIRECPGGSSFKPGDDPLITMTAELEEETGLGEAAGFAIDPSRLRKVGARQLCGTLSTHQAHVFAYELTEPEMAFLRKQAADNVRHGEDCEASPGERTYVEIHRVRDLLAADQGAVDWATLGMIFSALGVY